MLQQNFYSISFVYPVLGGTPVVQEPIKPSPVVVPSSPVAEKIQAAGTSSKPTSKAPTNAIAPQPVVKLVKLPASTIVSSCDTASNQEQIVEKAKQVSFRIENRVFSRYHHLVIHF